jgi:hypothetical protein
VDSGRLLTKTRSCVKKSDRARHLDWVPRSVASLRVVSGHDLQIRRDFHGSVYSFGFCPGLTAMPSLLSRPDGGSS